MKKIKIGLLPLYLELYDRISPPERRKPPAAFYASITDAFQRQGVEVVKAPICRLKPEFAAAVKAFEKAEVDAIVTLHLAYSPSLESASVLARTRLPLIVLDTTPDYDFGPTQSADKIMYNHGIHGVQDMCNLLIRNGKPFVIEAGHWKNSNVVERVVSRVRSARMVSAMRHARVGRIGEPFKGMGDFAVPPDVLRRTMGVVTVPCNVKTIRQLVREIRQKEIESEAGACNERFAIRNLDKSILCRSARVGLAVRRWIELKKLTGFTVNFLDVNRDSGLPTVPFLEACLGMARGIGYAGEGDVLTAALVGALASVFPATTFTEMFCPDWKGNRIFLSHMGEINPRLLTGRPRLVEIPFPYTDAEPPVRVAGCLRGGRAVLVNLAPLSDNRYRLIVAPVNMMAVKGRDRMADSIHGWFRPLMAVSDFLAEYSRLGGTHHAALVYGDAAREITGFGELMGWDTVVVEK